MAIGLSLLTVAALGQMDSWSLFPNGPFAAVYGNPANQGNFNGHFYLPGLAGLRASAGHTAFSLDDALDGDALQIEQVLESLDPENDLFASTDIPLLGAGFRVNDLYFRLGAALHVEQRFTYPGELLELAWYGNGHPDLIGRRLDFDGLAVNAHAYTDVFIGASGVLLDDRLKAGVNLHALTGVGGAYTSQSRFGLTTDANDYTITSDGTFEVQSAGVVSLDSLDADVTVDASDFLPGGSNSGWSIDAGISYRAGDLRIDAAAMNLGWIDWESNTKQYRLDETAFTFEGFDLSELTTTGDSITDIFEELADSLTTTYQATESSGTFRVPTNARFNATLRYEAWESGEVYGGFNAQQMFGRMYQGIHAGVRHSFGRVFALQGGAQWFEFDQLLLSIGMQLRLGPVVIFGATENLLAAFQPSRHRTFQGQFGLTFAIGHYAE